MYIALIANLSDSLLLGPERAFFVATEFFLTHFIMPSLFAPQSTRAMIAPENERRLPNFPQLRPLQRLRSLQSAITTLRLLPLFNPQQAFARWRRQRAMRMAARAAKQKNVDREWVEKFRLNGLTWHHLYISQDLRRIALFLAEIQKAMPERPEVSRHLVPLERSYAYLLDNVWEVYNSLERHVLFPWVLSGVDNDPAVAKALDLFGKERTRIEDAADVIQSRFSRLVCSTGYAYASLGPCTSPRRMNASRARRIKRKRERADAKARAAALTGDDKDKDSRSKKASLYLRDGYYPPEEETPTVAKVTKLANPDDLRSISADLAMVIEDTEKLHKMERGLLYPIIANTFPEREQNRLTHILVYSMRSALAKFIITIYHQAVEKRGSRSQWKWYKREVPLPIRVYTPVWRKRLFDHCPLGWLRQTPVRAITHAK